MTETLLHVSGEDWPALPPELAWRLGDFLWSPRCLDSAPRDDRQFRAWAEVITDIAWFMVSACGLSPAAAVAQLPRYSGPAFAAAARTPPLPPAARTPAVPLRGGIPGPRLPQLFQVRDGTPWCCHGPMRRVPAGVSERTGRPYTAFWGCAARGPGACRTRGWGLPPA